MRTSSIRLWKLQEFAWRVLAFLIFLAIAAAIGQFAPLVVIAACSAVCAFLVVEDFHYLLSGRFWHHVRYPLLFACTMWLMWFLKDHSVAIVITPPV